MTYQINEAVRNAHANTFESTVGTAPSLVIRTGTQPGSCAAAPTGTALVTMVLPSDWLSPAANGRVTMLGAWSGTAGATGRAGYFRIEKGGVCFAQGSVSDSANDHPDLLIDDADIVASNQVRAVRFLHYVGGA